MENKETNEKCCEDYNGELDITKSCIFCKTYLGSVVEKSGWEEEFTNLDTISHE